MAIRLGNERIQLRELQVDDWPDIHDYASRPEACRYQAWGPNTAEETRAFVAMTVETASEDPRVQYAFACTTLISDRAIGMGTLHIRSHRFRMGEVSCAIHPDYWRQGLATEIVRLLLKLGFDELGLHRIQATCDPRNIASSRVIEKVGMTYEGRLRDTMLIRDGWRDSAMYSILEPEWRAT